jgi:RimJ/RimL family protein N-acetyltransferase
MRKLKLNREPMLTKVRKVRPSDHEAILEISKHIWDGQDYLPSVVDEWLKDPNSHTYGVEFNNRLVAIANLRVIEEGKTGWMEGLRVHQNYRGKGYADALTRHLIEKGEQLGVHRLRYTAVTENEASLKIASNYAFSKVFEVGVFSHPNPKIRNKIAAYPDIRESNPKETYTLLKRNPSLIPHKTLIYDWKALEVSPKSLEIIGKTCRFFTALKGGQVDSFSLVYLRRQESQSIWMTTIYAKEPIGFMSQLSCDIDVAQDEGTKPMMCTYEIEHEKTLHDYSLLSTRRWRTHVILLERQLHKSSPTSEKKAATQTHNDTIAASPKVD